jgi:hypothetical protein
MGMITFHANIGGSAIQRADMDSCPVLRASGGRGIDDRRAHIHSRGQYRQDEGRAQHKAGHRCDPAKIDVSHGFPLDVPRDRPSRYCFSHLVPFDHSIDGP